MSIAALLPLGEEINPGQNRLSNVQLVNWGTFNGAHTIHVDRAGTLLTGDSGVGKSTIFDGILQIMDARPRMNEAAHADAGRGREDRRTTFSYMRGRLGTTSDGSLASTSYQRPAGTWSAIGLTFDNTLGRIVSISALMDLGANGSENSIGRFYLIHDRPLDVAAIEAKLTGRLSRATLETILPGSQAFDSHKQFFERFRQLLGIENPRAFGLLRILQSGRGISGTVNDFFRNHVLDTPKTLDAAEAAAEDFGNLSGIWRQLERVRQQRDHLQAVPGTHERYFAASESLARNRSLREEALPAFRHEYAVSIEEITQDRLAAEAATMVRELSQAEERQAGFQGQVTALRAQYASEGGGRMQSLEREVELARALLSQRAAIEATVRQDLAAAQLDVPDPDAPQQGVGAWDAAASATGWSEAGLEAARDQAAAVAREIALAADAAKELSHDAHGEAANLRRQIKMLEQQIESFRQRTSNIHPEAIRCRNDICASLGLAEENIPFAGELVDVPAEHAQWRPAAERALRTLATSMLVPGEHIRAVTRFLNRTNLQGLFRCINVSEPIAPQRQGDGDTITTLITKLVTRDTPTGQWVKEKIASHYDYPCVENEDELAALSKGISLGGVVKANSTTLVKDNRTARRSDYVLGFDNKEKIAALGDDLLELESQHRRADELSLERSRQQQELTDRLAAIRRVTGETRRWAELSADPQRQALAQAQAKLARAQDDNEDLAQLQFEMETAQLNYDGATASIAVARADLARFSTELTACTQRLESLRAKVRGASAAPSAREDLQAYFAPHGEMASQAQLEDAVGRVERQLLAEQNLHTSARLDTENALVRIFETFRDKWGSDYGVAVSSAADYVAHYHGIVSEGLPQRQAEFREYFNNRTYEGFSALLHLLDEERRSISTRLAPLNEVLGSVEYHAGSHLHIEVRTAIPAAAAEFKTALRNALPPLGRRQDEAAMDAQFRALHTIVERLKDPNHRQWRAEVLDTRGHAHISCTRIQSSGTRFTHQEVGTMSGGEGQRFDAFMMAAALAYQLGIVEQGFSTYGTLMMDEAFVKASPSFAQASINALHAFGFQLLLAAPEDKIDLSRFLGSATEILRNEATNESGFVPAGQSLANPVDIVLRSVVGVEGGALPG